MAKAKQPESSAIYQLKVTLKGLRPPIWRRLQVPSDFTLGQLHDVLQIAMGWTDSHLHQFIIGRTYYSQPDYELEGVEDENKVRLDRVARAEKAKFVYEYDFGDSWQHDIVVEKILPREEGVRYPICIAGKRAGPPEDCGGIWGYADLLEIIQDPEHEEYEDMMEWLGGELDPEAFDLEEVNRKLRRIR